MKHAFAWAISLAQLLPQISHSEGKNMTQDEQDVLAAIERMTQSFMANDIASVMASYESKATVVFDPEQPVSDATQLEQMFSGMAGVSPVFEYPSGHDVVVVGDVALHISPWTMSGVAPDGQEISQAGLSVAVLRRQDDGSWRMIIDNPHGGRLLETK
ncbi:MAG: DUF4440 domain-containing protein [Pseudomonadota bacterium]